MSSSATLHSGFAQTRPAAIRTIVSLVVAAWLLAVFVLGAQGFFVASTGKPPLALLVAFAGPLVVFLAAFRWSDAFRSFALGIDPRVLLGMQAWRFAGFGFVALMAYSVLPGYFAWPAGLGDMAIGLTAPWMIVLLNRRPEFASSGGFTAWNLLGILDLVNAMGIGAIGSMLLANSGAQTTAAMAQLPLVLVPVYLVPLFLMMHFTALFQARRRTA